MNDYKYLDIMYGDDYYPNELVQKIEDILLQLVGELEQEDLSPGEQQAMFDHAMFSINDLQDEFDEQGSEIETVARDAIATDIEEILTFYNCPIDLEDAMRERDW